MCVCVCVCVCVCARNVAVVVETQGIHPLCESTVSWAEATHRPPEAPAAAPPATGMKASAGICPPHPDLQSSPPQVGFDSTPVSLFLLLQCSCRRAGLLTIGFCCTSKQFFFCSVAFCVCAFFFLLLRPPFPFFLSSSSSSYRHCFFKFRFVVVVVFGLL